MDIKKIVDVASKGAENVGNNTRNAVGAVTLFLMLKNKTSRPYALFILSCPIWITMGICIVAANLYDKEYYMLALNSVLFGGLLAMFFATYKGITTYQKDVYGVKIEKYTGWNLPLMNTCLIVFFMGLGFLALGSSIYFELKADKYTKIFMLAFFFLIMVPGPVILANKSYTNSLNKLAKKEVDEVK